MTGCLTEQETELIAAIDRLTAQVTELRRAVGSRPGLTTSAVDGARSPIFPEGSNLPLDELPLSLRPRNCLKIEGWYWLADIATGLSDAELLRIPNFGRKSLAEVHGVAHEHGWRMPAPASVLGRELPGIGDEDAARFCEAWLDGRSLFEFARELGVYGAAAIDNAMMRFVRRWRKENSFGYDRSMAIKTSLERFRSGTEAAKDTW